MLAKLEGHKKTIRGIALPSGHDKLYSGSSDGTARIWDGHTGKCLHFTNLGDEAGSLITEGAWVFIGMKNAVKALNIHSDFELNLKGPVGQVYAMIVAGDMLFAGHGASLEGHNGAVSCLAVGDKMLFSGSLDKTITGVLTLCGMNDAETKPVLFCSCNDDSVCLYDLPSSFCERGRIFSKREVRVIERGPKNLFFTGDASGSLTVWKWRQNSQESS
ncbi:hypothetical protein Gohar_026661 [Gossypium harknessii]|uniref:Zinc finger CCCH domain-containing protein 48-like n=1 Tax=Gossypium harknessii TaxID=34285 RepID=A0A7J9HS80_9ROSI|nr:hypothetical protein [Gossypium harknessii]